MRIAVRGSFEAAHRLTMTPGNCMNIHGHSFRVRLQLEGALNNYGMVRDFRDVKKAFRQFLERYDHMLLLNEQDILASQPLPGLLLCPAEPTTENIAKWIGEWAEGLWGTGAVEVTVHETEHNEAVYP